MLEARVSVIGSGSFRLVKLSNSTFHINLYSSRAHTVQVDVWSCNTLHSSTCSLWCVVELQHIACIMAALAHCDVWVCLQHIVQQYLHSSICQLWCVGDALLTALVASNKKLIKVREKGEGGMIDSPLRMRWHRHSFCCLLLAARVGTERLCLSCSPEAAQRLVATQRAKVCTDSSIQESVTLGVSRTAEQ